MGRPGKHYILTGFSMALFAVLGVFVGEGFFIGATDQAPWMDDCQFYLSFLGFAVSATGFFVAAKRWHDVDWK